MKVIWRLCQIEETWRHITYSSLYPFFELFLSWLLLFLPLPKSFLPWLLLEDLSLACILLHELLELPKERKAYKYCFYKIVGFQELEQTSFPPSEGLSQITFGSICSKSLCLTQSSLNSATISCSSEVTLMYLNIIIFITHSFCIETFPKFWYEGWKFSWIFVINIFHDEIMKSLMIW